MLRDFDLQVDNHVSSYIKRTNHFRWFVLLMNLTCAGFYLVLPIAKFDFFLIPFHITIGVSLFVFLTKMRKKAIQEQAVRKLTRGRTHFGD